MWLGAALLLMSTKRWWGAGLAYAAAILTRRHLAVAAAIAGLGEGIARRSLKPVLQVGLTSSLGVAALVGYNKLVFGKATILVGIYEQRPDNATQGAAATVSGDYHVLLNFVGTFVSPVRGVLVLSPFLILLLPGVRAAWRVAPSWVRSAAWGGVAYMVIQLFGNYFAGGSNFYSYRLPIEMLTLAAPLLALCWREWTSRTSARRVAFAVLAVFSVVQHAAGAFIFFDPSDVRTRAWSRYLFVEALDQANLVELLVLTGIAAGSTFIAYRLLKVAAEPPPVCVESRLASQPQVTV